MTNPSMNATDLQVLRGIDDQMVLQKNIKPVAAQEAFFGDGAIPAGRVLSRNADGEGELGVKGHDVPYWLFRKTNRPSLGWSGESAQTATGLTWADGSAHVALCYTGIEGMEMASTEFAGTASDFGINDLITTRHSSNAAFTTDAERAAGAGKIEKMTAGQYGAVPIVGVVSEKSADYARHGNTYIVFYTLYRPAIEALANGVTNLA